MAITPNPTNLPLGDGFVKCNGAPAGDFYIEWRGGKVFWCQDASGKLFDAHLCIERAGWKEAVEPYTGHPGDYVMTFWEGQKFAWRWFAWREKCRGWPRFALALVTRPMAPGIVRAPLAS